MKLTDDHLEVLFDDHAPDLLRYFAHRVVDLQAAVDLVSETYAQALKARSRFRGSTLEEARPWLFGIAKNLLRRYYRNGKIEQKAMERMRMERVTLTDDQIAEIEEFADLKDLHNAIERNWDVISEDQRSAIRDRVVDGLDYADIAKRTGVAEATVRSRVSRGLVILREAIEAERMSPEGNTVD